MTPATQSVDLTFHGQRVTLTGTVFHAACRTHTPDNRPVHRAKPLRRPMQAGTLKSMRDVELPVIAQPKIDGVRVWIDHGGVPRTRSGKPLVNRDLDAALRKFALKDVDGELRAEDGFDATLSLINHHTGIVPFTYFVFDRLRDVAMTEDRLGDLPEPEIIGDARLNCLSGQRIETLAQLKRFEAEAAERGDCDGIILRNPYGRYHGGRDHGRYSSLLKYKRVQDDEAVITGILNAGALQTRWRGRALPLQAKNHRFTMADIGQTVSFKFNDTTEIGTPRHARLWRRRQGDPA